MTKALIYGTGSIGSVYGYILDRAGVEVTAVCRSNFDVVKEHGIRIDSGLWGEVRYQPNVANSVENACNHGPFDYVFVCTKAFPGNTAPIKPAVSPETAILLAQNGIGIEEEYATVYPHNTIISAVVWVPASPISPGVVKHGPLERIGLGTYPSQAPDHAKAKVQDLAQLWSAGGGSPTVHDDIQGERWGKLSVNAAVNPMGALSRCDTVNLILSSDIADETIVKVLEEVGSVAAAEGYPGLASDEMIEKNLSWQRGSLKTGGKDASMLVDVKASRPIEVDAILGNTIKIAKRHGIDVPRLEMLYTLAQALNFSIEKPEGRWMPTKF